MKTRQFEFASLVFNEDKNILFLRVRQGITVDVYEISEMIRYVQEFVGEIKHYAVIDFGANLLSTTEARAIYAKSEYIQKYRIADAFLVRSLSVRLVANFFIKVTKPKVNTKLFLSEEKAVGWIQSLQLKSTV